MATEQKNRDMQYAVRLVDAMIGECEYNLRQERETNKALSAAGKYDKRWFFYENWFGTLISVRKRLSGELMPPRLYNEAAGRRLIREHDREIREAEKFAAKAVKRK